MKTKELTSIEDPLELMNAICKWRNPPSHSEKWTKAVAAACEVAIANKIKAKELHRALIVSLNEIEKLAEENKKLSKIIYESGDAKLAALILASQKRVEELIQEQNNDK